MHPIRDEIQTCRNRLTNQLMALGLKRSAIKRTMDDMDQIIGLEKAFLAEVIVKANQSIGEEQAQ
jgi:hypothetical protein